MNIWWIRHMPIENNGCYIGQTDIPALIPDYQAQLAMPLPDDALWFATPMLRTIDTAHWLMSATTAPLRMAPDLLEQHFGPWEEKPYEEVWRAEEGLHDWSKPETVRPEGGESFADLCERVDGWLDLQLVENTNSNIIIVAHAGSIRAGMRHALGVTPAQALAFQVDYGSITQVEYYAGETIARVNYVNR